MTRRLKIKQISTGEITLDEFKSYCIRRNNNLIYKLHHDFSIMAHKNEFDSFEIYIMTNDDELTRFKFYDRFSDYTPPYDIVKKCVERGCEHDTNCSICFENEKIRMQCISCGGITCINCYGHSYELTVEDNTPHKCPYCRAEDTQNIKIDIIAS